MIGEKTRVAVLQNGVEHVERFTPFVDPARILPCVVDIPAERIAPGRIHHRRDGTILTPSGPMGEDFIALFADSVIAGSVVDDFKTAAWTKLALNCVGAVNALSGLPSGIARQADVAGLMRALAVECVAVGRAEGARLGDDLADLIIDRTQASPPDSINSLLADRLAGRRMEWDARNGVITRKGSVHGILTPLNQMAATLLSAVEQGGYRLAG